MNLKIAVFYSFESPILEEFQKPEYIKVFCGSKDGVSKEFLDKMDYFDDVGENISNMNRYINEMTGIYWMYKNYDRIGNPDFIGTAHYRRYIDFYYGHLDDDSVMCHFEKQPYSIFQTYSLYHVKNDIITFNRSFSRKYQEYAIDLNDYMNQNIQSVRNMFVMSRKTFLEYCQFLEKCFGILVEIQSSLNLDTRDKYQLRGMGFILERMTGFWMFYKSRHSKCNFVDSSIVSKDIDSPYQRM